MECTCDECREHGGPNPAVMGLKFVVLFAQLSVALVGLLKERSFKALAVFLGAIGFFFTLPRYLICARCDGYGKNCYPYYLGKITSLYMPRVEGKTVTPYAAALEGLTLGTIFNAPVFGLWRNRKALLTYLTLGEATFLLHFWHACRHCARYATDWRKDCVGAKAARRVFGDARDVAF